MLGREKKLTTGIQTCLTWVLRWKKCPVYLTLPYCTITFYKKQTDSSNTFLCLLVEHNFHSWGRCTMAVMALTSMHSVLISNVSSGRYNYSVMQISVLIEWYEEMYVLASTYTWVHFRGLEYIVTYQAPPTCAIVQTNSVAFLQH